MSYLVLLVKHGMIRPSWLCVIYFFFFFQSEKLLLYDTVQSELEEKIRRLEEDRHSIDITSGEGNAVTVMFK